MGEASVRTVRGAPAPRVMRCGVAAAAAGSGSRALSETRASTTASSGTGGGSTASGTGTRSSQLLVHAGHASVPTVIVQRPTARGRRTGTATPPMVQRRAATAAAAVQPAAPAMPLQRPVVLPPAVPWHAQYTLPHYEVGSALMPVSGRAMAAVTRTAPVAAIPRAAPAYGTSMSGALTGAALSVAAAGGAPVAPGMSVSVGHLPQMGLGAAITPAAVGSTLSSAYGRRAGHDRLSVYRSSSTKRKVSSMLLGKATVDVRRTRKKQPSPVLERGARIQAKKTRRVRKIPSAFTLQSQFAALFESDHDSAKKALQRRRMSGQKAAAACASGGSVAGAAAAAPSASGSSHMAAQLVRSAMAMHVPAGAAPPPAAATQKHQAQEVAKAVASAPVPVPAACARPAPTQPLPGQQYQPAAQQAQRVPAARPAVAAPVPLPLPVRARAVGLSQFPTRVRTVPAFPLDEQYDLAALQSQQPHADRRHRMQLQPVGQQQGQQQQEAGEQPSHYESTESFHTALEALQQNEVARSRRNVPLPLPQAQQQAQQANLARATRTDAFSVI